MIKEATFTEVMDALSEQDGVYSAPVPENWKQGRTAYGGFTAALLLRAARLKYPDLPPLRSVMVNFTAPVTAPPQISVEVLRQGRNITTVSVRSDVDGKPAAVATFTFGHSQDSHVSSDLAAPDALAPEDTEPYFPPAMKQLPIRFAENFDLRLIEGDRPFMGAERGYARVWARHKDPACRGSFEDLLGIADILPPAVFPTCTRPGPNSSVNWICNFMREDLTTRDGWWMMDTNLSAARNGYSSQVMRVWNTQGEIVVDGMQSVIIFV